jgi:Fic family protein
MRCLLSRRADLRLSSQIRLERGAHYKMLEYTQKGDLDIAPWLEWFSGCMDRAFDSADAVLASVFRKSRFWERHRGVAFNARQRDMLTRLLSGFEGKLTSSKWAKIEKCSPDTALRDINELIVHGILVKDEAGGRSTSYSLA